LYLPRMPLFLVRWPHLRASIIRARDEEHLKDILDEVDDPGGCTWSLYRGPLWVDFWVPVEFVPKFREDGLPMTSDEFELKGVEALVDDVRMKVSAERDSETSLQMETAVLEKAFPATAKLAESSYEAGGKVAELETALREDLKPLLQYDWRLANEQRAEGPEAEARRTLGVSVPPTWLGPGKGEKE
jgi:hypothetical protein